MGMIYCYDASGKATPISAQNVQFRPAVYGIFIENEQVLLQRHPETNLWQPPGDLLEARQTPTQAVKYYLRQTLTMTPVVGPLLFVEEQYRLEKGQAWRLSVLYYALDRPPLTAASFVDLDHTIQTQWVALGSLRREQMQFGYEAIRAGQLRLKL
jgi:ADP-ribose pyrophosphatase YjhB (NUDIX family)